MSEPGERVHDAIAEAVREENPGYIVTAYVLVIEMTNGEDFTAFVHDAAEGQALAHTLGLLDVGREFHRRRIGDRRGDE